MESVKGVSRRSFLKGAALLGTTMAGASVLAGCSSEPEGPVRSVTFPEAWDYETDIVIVGFGGAGAAAAITAANEGLGEVIVLEAGPEEAAGGNTRVSGNLMFIPDNADDAVRYQTALNGPYHVEEELLQAWADELVKNLEWLEDMGANMVQMPLFSPEFPELDGSDTVKTYCIDGKFNAPSLWDFLQEQIDDLGVQVLFDHRAMELIFDSITKEVFGLKAVTSNGDVYLKARKGVILACGSLENNPELVQKYFNMGTPKFYPLGTPYNRGDGFEMVKPLNVELWHTNNTAGNGFGIQLPDPDCDNAICPTWPKGSDYIFLGADCKRFMCEESYALARHGKQIFAGSYISRLTPTPGYAVFGPKTFNESQIAYVTGYTYANGIAPGTTNQELLDAGVIVKGETVAELAEKLGVNAKALEENVSRWNQYCAEGHDYDFGRGREIRGSFSMDNQLQQSGVTQYKEESVIVEAFEIQAINAPYYGVKLVPQFLNGQGGPKRGTKGEVMGVDGNAIPRLFAAGEFGTVYAYQYNGGGNVSEALSSGRIAVRAAAALEAWE